MITLNIIIFIITIILLLVVSSVKVKDKSQC